jgi:hypothetical protein
VSGQGDDGDEFEAEALFGTIGIVKKDSLVKQP